MLLLTDGSVLAQGAGTRYWWKLAPDSAGRYVAGTWQRVSSSRNAPLYFASAVLRNGKVLVAGGKQNAGQPANLCAAELYDPVSDTWIDLPTPAGWNEIGDAPCCVLPDGRVLLGSIADNRCALFDPGTLTWAAANPKLNPDSSEETWTLLRDGTVLTVECSGNPAASELYVDGTWMPNSAARPDLVAAGSREIGPAILLPDGRVFAIGATGDTSLFTPDAVRGQPGTWVQGPSFPRPGGLQLAAKDAPACLLPNGRVLCAAGPAGGAANLYAGPAQFYEFDPNGNVLTPLPAQPANGAGPPSAWRMLLLPDGSVLFGNGTPMLWIYEPGGAPDPAWPPVISYWPREIVAGTIVSLEGTQLNGLSQACSYGDDASMATNYPIVRLRSGEPNGAVIYCRSFNHSTMAVATGAAVQSTCFAVPERTPAGAYRLAVIANGIASAERPAAVRVPNGQPDRLLSPEQLAMQHELFWRELNEVHLLMDFVSGRSDKSLADLKEVPDPDNPAEKLAPGVVVQRVCEIRFPPEGDAKTRARQAALLLNVKDELNALADPARGLPVAFTAMFSGVALPQQTQTVQPPATGQDRYSFAIAAYPHLENYARNFRRSFLLVPFFTVFWGFLTALVYWDVALSSGALNKVSGLETLQAGLAQPGHPFIPTGQRCDPKTIDSSLANDDREVCRKFEDLQADLDESRKDLGALTERHLWRHPVGWIMRVFSGKQNRIGHLEEPREQFAAVVVGVFTNYVVPMMFGLLGTFAGIIRSTWAKVRESTLHPQDWIRTVGTVPLGLIGGLAVGLLLSPSAAPPQGLSSPAGAITLSAAALAFLAGYGVEAFFSMIDDLLKRVFALGNTAATK